MTSSESSDRNDALRKAIEWIVTQDGPTAAFIGAAARLFDLSPKDEAFLVRYFREE